MCILSKEIFLSEEIKLESSSKRDFKQNSFILLIFSLIFAREIYVYVFYKEFYILWDIKYKSYVLYFVKNFVFYTRLSLLLSWNYYYPYINLSFPRVS